MGTNTAKNILLKSEILSYQTYQDKTQNTGFRCVLK